MRNGTLAVVLEVRYVVVVIRFAHRKFVFDSVSGNEDTWLMWLRMINNGVVALEWIFISQATLKNKS